MNKKIWQDARLAFLAKFFAIFALAELLLFTLDLSIIQNFIASSIALQLGLDFAGNYIFAKGGVFVIVPSCTGLVGTSVLGAIIFSLKKPEVRQKIAIFFAGAILLIILNYFRVLFVVWLGAEFGMGLAEIAHVVSWFVASSFVIVLWYFFTKKAAGIKDFSGFL
ncbi:MAG: exosortase/archaeosortase family protein [archaeon]|nr:exosortase/archaeosortase family protein [archaeon]